MRGGGAPKREHGPSKREHRLPKREHRLPKAEHELPAVGGSPAGSKKGDRGGRPAPMGRKSHGSEPEPSDSHAPSGVRSPRSPSGRKTRIRIRIEKTIDCVQSLPGECHVSPLLNDWISPIRSAPRTAPERLPIPPSTAAVKAISPSWKPWSYRTEVK